VPLRVYHAGGQRASVRHSTYAESFSVADLRRRRRPSFSLCYVLAYTAVSVYGFIFKRRGNDRVVADFVTIYQRPSRRHFFAPMAAGDQHSHPCQVPYYTHNVTSNTTPKSKCATTIRPSDNNNNAYIGRQVIV